MIIVIMSTVVIIIIVVFVFVVVVAATDAAAVITFQLSFGHRTLAAETPGLGDDNDANVNNDNRGGGDDNG